MSKITPICPQCFSDKIHVKMGGSRPHNASIDFSSTDDFYTCPSCQYYGNRIFEGNDRFVSFLKEMRLAEELLKNPQVEALEEKPLLAPAQTQLVLME